MLEMDSNMELGGLQQVEGAPTRSPAQLGKPEKPLQGAGKAILPHLGFVSILVNHKNILFLLYRIAYGCSREGRGGPMLG